MVHRLSEEQAKLAAKLLSRAKLGHQPKLSNQAIAKKAGYNEKVVRDVLHHRCLVSETVLNVCRAVGVDLEKSFKEAGLTDHGRGSAPGHLGGYARDVYAH